MAAKQLLYGQEEQIQTSMAAVRSTKLKEQAIKHFIVFKVWMKKCVMGMCLSIGCVS
jgi:hypothetical protein